MRLPPLCTRFRLSPVRALLYLLNLLHLLNAPCWAVGASAPFPKAWRAKPAMPLQAPGPDVRFTRTHGPPLRRLLCVLRVLCDSQNTLAVLPAAARRPSLCSSVTLREPLCSSAICGSHTGSPGRRGRTYRTNRTYRTAAGAALHRGLIRRALAARSLFTVLCSLFSGAALPPLPFSGRQQPPLQSANQPISSKRGAAAPFCLQLLTEKR